MISRLRQPVSGLTHLGGAIAALVGTIVLLTESGAGAARLALSVYGASLISLFSASSIYHMVRTVNVNGILRKFDHSAIYLLIAGSYTPFCVLAFRGFWKWDFLAIIWGLAVVGIVLKIWFINAPRWVTAGVYVIMGWLSIFAAQEMMATLPVVSMTWLILGGLIYTAGAVVYATKRMDFYPGVFGFHEVWHIFVLLGALSHFIAIYTLLISTH